MHYQVKESEFKKLSELHHCHATVSFITSLQILTSLKTFLLFLLPHQIITDRHLDGQNTFDTFLKTNCKTEQSFKE